MPEDESEDEWRFSVDDFDDSSREASAAAHEGDPTDGPTSDDRPASVEDADGDGNVAGDLSPNVPVVPEKPALENAVFVTLGSVLTILAFVSLLRGASFGLVDVLTVVALVGGFGAVAYGAFVRLTPDT